MATSLSTKVTELTEELEEANARIQELESERDAVLEALGLEYIEDEEDEDEEDYEEEQ